MRPKLNLKAQLAFFLNKRGWSPSELARRSGAPRQSISDWMAGTPPRNLTLLKRVAGTLGTSVDNLLFGHGFEETPDMEGKRDLKRASQPERDSVSKSRATNPDDPSLLGANENGLWFSVLKMDGTIVQMNDVLQRALGHPPEDTLGRPASDFLAESDLSLYNQILLEFGQNRKSIDGVFFRMVCQNGTIRWGYWQGVLLETNRMIYWIGSDSTSRFALPN